MITVYFDRNVFADICELRNNLTNDDVEIIKQAIDSGKISIPMSSALLAETAAVLQESSVKFKQHINTFFSLIDKKRIVKQPDDLLRDDCVSFAYLAPYQRTLAISDIGRKHINSPKINNRWILLSKKHHPAIKNSVKNINDAILFWRDERERKNIKTSDDFIEVWEEYSPKLIERLLKELPSDVKTLCKNHGIQNMLKIRSIRLYTTYYSWILFSGLGGVQGNPKNLQAGDFMDFIHTIQASVATIFVTQENKEKANKIPFILNKLPFSDLKTINIGEFLKFIKSL